MNFIKTLFIVILFSGATYAQNQNPIEEKPFIEVNGVAEQEIIPDQIYISIIIREKYENKEKITIESQEEKLKALLKEINIPTSNLYLSDANADYVKVKFRTKDVLTKKDYTLKVSSATAVGQVFQQLEKLEINDANVSKVSHSKIDSLRKEIRIAAIKAAKTKADYLLNAIGEQTGKPLIVRENSNGNLEYNYNRNSNTRVTSYQNVRFLDDSDKSVEDEEIQFQKIKIQSSIYVKFLIK
ncbi:MAG: hypothetical protein C0448_15615 [Sphingobacteriaceae bacterium]|nr:hypothetical protein [Sphingobacteriaceae bacterium]